MANTSNKIILAGLDFDTIKTNLKTYLRSQSEFEDFNFEGSAMSQLLNMMAMNTHMLSFYLNMVASESFLDTAVLRSTIVSHAKMLGYTPRSVTSSLAVVNVAITKANSDPTSALTMPRFTKFSSEALNGVSYNFITTESLTVSANGDVFDFTNVEIKEGNPVTKVYIYNSSSNPDQSFDLLDPSIDISTLEVIVQTSENNIEQQTFTLADDATEVMSATSSVFYLEEGTNGNYKIYFGDGILGKSLVDGNVVRVTYIISNGENANDIGRFRIQSSLLSGSTANTSTVVNSTSGSPAETPDSIKFAAPKSYLSQNRAVTKNDYINVINRRYPYFAAISVWGGEENDPPVYGKVFLSVKPKAGFAVTEAQKQYVIESIIQPISVMTVLPEFVDPDYNYLNFRITVYYDPRQTNYTANEISDIVRQRVAQFAEDNLNTFNNKFKISRLLRSIDDSDTSINSSSADIFIEKRLDAILNQAKTYELSFGTPLNRGLGKNKLYSSPAFVSADFNGVERDCYLEETPESSTGVESISVLSPGTGFTEDPTLVISGDGEGANAYAVIVNGQIESVVVDNPGSNYTEAQVTITGNTGSGASLEAIVEGTIGTLRSYYYDSSNIKSVMKDDAGVINYVDGTIELTNFYPTDVKNTTKTLSVFVQPLDSNFSSTLNRILTYDDTLMRSSIITVRVDNE